MTTIDIVLEDGGMELLELVCWTCGLESDLADPETQLLEPQRCGECARASLVEDLDLAA